MHSVKVTVVGGFVLMHEGEIPMGAIKDSSRRVGDVFGAERAGDVGFYVRRDMMLKSPRDSRYCLAVSCRFAL